MRLSGRLPERISAGIPRLPAIFFILIALLGCGEGYETRTKRGGGIKEWFLPLGEGKVEAMAVWPPGGGRRPALLLVHAATGRAQRFRRAMFDLSRQGVVAMSISLPGFGGSTGPEDFAGPRSVAAVLEAARYLASRRDVSGIAVYGYGQGATTALIAAIRGTDIRLVAVEGGEVDSPSSFLGSSSWRSQSGWERAFTPFSLESRRCCGNSVGSLAPQRRASTGFPLRP